MANSIALAKKYTALLDEVYAVAALTQGLDSPSELFQEGANANEIVIPKLSLQGLATYSRNSGYVSGDATLTYETVTFDYDRGRKFQIDSQDDAETIGVAFGRLGGEFVRTKVAPEIDAYRFAKYASTSGISTVAEAALTTGALVVSALRLAVTTQDEASVDLNDRELFITPTLYGLVQDLDTTSSREVLARFSKITLVPTTRFYTQVTLAADTAGGYSKTSSTGRNINFLIIQKSAVIQINKHVTLKIFSPDQNQDADAWIFNYRVLGLADVYDNKLAGIYLNKYTS